MFTKNSQELAQYALCPVIIIYVTVDTHVNQDQGPNNNTYYASPRLQSKHALYICLHNMYLPST